MELRTIIDAVKKLDYGQKEATNELIKVQNAYEEKMKDITGSGGLQRYKQSLLKLKMQVRGLQINEGVMLNTLFSCGGMRQGSHHLYDDIGEGTNDGQHYDNDFD